MSSQEEQRSQRFITNTLHLFHQWAEQDMVLADLVRTEVPFSGTKEQLEQIAAKTFAGAEGVNYHVERLENGQLVVLIHAEEKKLAWLKRWWPLKWRKKK